MLYPTINELTKNEFNRYELAIATAKCARIITGEYVKQREQAEASMTGNKETDKPLNTMIDKEVRDEKAVKLAINRIHQGQYTIVHKDPAEQEREEQAILAGINRPYDDYADEVEEDTAEEDAIDVVAEALEDEALEDEALEDEADEN